MHVGVFSFLLLCRFITLTTCPKFKHCAVGTGLVLYINSGVSLCVHCRAEGASEVELQ